ncbi:MAG: polyphosphate:AMP phosphotransferase, partial [Gammaproteobacteria bacterium]
MFEAAEVGRSISKQAFKEAEPEVHGHLLQLQQKLRQSGRSLVVIVSGVEGAGKGEVVDKLNRWFDTRDVQTHGYWDETDEEKERPRFWRFWRTLPARGTVAVMFGSWYTRPIIDHAFDVIDVHAFEHNMQLIEELERELVRDGTIFVKLWFHLSAREQKKRLEDDARSNKLKKKSPLLDKFSKSYDRFREVSERAIRLTDSGFSSWHIIEATDGRYRDLTVGHTLIATLERELNSTTSTTIEPGKSRSDTNLEQALAIDSSMRTVLDNIDLDQSLTEEQYTEQLN